MVVLPIQVLLSRLFIAVCLVSIGGIEVHETTLLREVPEGTEQIVGI